MALAVSAGVFVVALTYGLFALVKPYVGSAGGAGVVAGAAALFIAIIAMILSGMGRPPPRKKISEPQSFVERASEFIKERPVLAGRPCWPCPRLFHQACSRSCEGPRSGPCMK